jgi:hypothetical protein
MNFDRMSKKIIFCSYFFFFLTEKNSDFFWKFTVSVIQPFLIGFFRQFLNYFFPVFSSGNGPCLTHLKPLHPKVKGRMRENEAFSRNRHSLPGKLGRLLILTILSRKAVVPLAKTPAHATHGSHYSTCLGQLGRLGCLGDVTQIEMMRYRWHVCQQWTKAFNKQVWTKALK